MYQLELLFDSLGLYVVLFFKVSPCMYVCVCSIVATQRREEREGGQC